MDSLLTSRASFSLHLLPLLETSGEGGGGGAGGELEVGEAVRGAEARGDSGGAGVVIVVDEAGR